MNIRKAIAIAVATIVGVTFFFSSCKKNDLPDTGGVLSFSTDTVQFDTIFSTMGSTTKAFKVYNPGNKSVVIDEIKLAGGNTSQFRLNIDGSPVNKATNVEIESGDSLYIFVEVTVDPQNLNTPFVCADSVVFTTGGAQQRVMLVAWGQDANFFNATTNVNDEGLPKFAFLECGSNTMTWTNEKPYVIFGSLIVPSGCTLTIEPGTQVYFYKNSNLVIDEGATLIVNGTAQDKVTFGGTRLEDYMENVPGQWGTYVQRIINGQVFRFPVGGIWFAGNSSGNKINHAVIKNAFYGVMVGENCDLELTNTEIYNNNGMGLVALKGNIIGYNNVVSNAGQYSVALLQGGTYDFRHCTFTNYWADGVRQTPTLLLNNYIDDNGAITADPNFSAYFGNCIIYGNIDEEIGHDFSGSIALLKYDRCLIKVGPDFDTSNQSIYVNIIKNPNPELQFESTFDNDFHLDTLTVAQDAADPVITNNVPTIDFDIDGHSRQIPFGEPDLGAYEREN